MADELEKLKLELLEARSTVKVQETKINQLAEQVGQLQERIVVLQKERSSLAPENLATVFYTVLNRMQEGLQGTEGKLGYQVNKFETQMKVAMVLDKDDKLAFQLPKIDDVIPPENLSILNLTFTPTTTIAPANDLQIVPNLIGLRQEVATEKLVVAGFKVGKINKRISKSLPGTVLDQVPEAYARAPSGSPIDLILAKPNLATTPNVVGLQLADASKILDTAGLVVGKVQEQSSKSPSGIVIGQSIKPDSPVPMGSLVDLMVAIPEMVKVPDVVGKLITPARKMIVKSGFKVGNVTEKIDLRMIDKVISQSPNPDTDAQSGSEINLVIGSKSIIEKKQQPEKLPRSSTSKKQ